MLSTEQHKDLQERLAELEAPKKKYAVLPVGYSGCIPQKAYVKELTEKQAEEFLKTHSEFKLQQVVEDE